MSLSNAFRNFILYLTMGMDFSRPNHFSTFVEAGIFLPKTERRQMIAFLKDYEAYIVSDEQVETLWEGSGARFFISPERARRQFLFIARLYLEQSMRRPDLEDMNAGQTRGKPIERLLTQQESEALKMLFLEIVETPQQTRLFKNLDKTFWKKSLNRTEQTLILGIAKDIAGGSITEAVLELALHRLGSGKSGVNNLSLQELVFIAAFEFEKLR